MNTMNTDKALQHVQRAVEIMSFGSSAEAAMRNLVIFQPKEEYEMSKLVRGILDLDSVLDKQALLCMVKECLQSLSNYTEPHVKKLTAKKFQSEQQQKTKRPPRVFGHVVHLQKHVYAFLNSSDGDKHKSDIHEMAKCLESTFTDTLQRHNVTFSNASGKFEGLTSEKHKQPAPVIRREIIAGVHITNLEMFQEGREHNMSSLVAAILNLKSQNTKQELLGSVQYCLELLLHYHEPHVESLHPVMMDNKGEHSAAFKEVYFLQKEVHGFLKAYDRSLCKDQSKRIANNLLETFTDELNMDNVTYNTGIGKFEGLSDGPHRKVVHPVVEREIKEHKIIPDLKTFKRGGIHDLSVLIHKIMQLDNDFSREVFLEKIEMCLKVLISSRVAQLPDPQLPGLAPHFFSEHVRPRSDNESDDSDAMIKIVWELQQLASVFAKELKNHLRKTEEDQRSFEFKEFKENANVINGIATDLQEIFNDKMDEWDLSIHKRHRFRMS